MRKASARFNKAKNRALDLLDRLRYRLTCTWANLMFFVQMDGHWLNRLLRPFWIMWQGGRLLIGLTRGIGPADIEDTDDE